MPRARDWRWGWRFGGGRGRQGRREAPPVWGNGGGGGGGGRLLCLRPARVGFPRSERQMGGRLSVARRASVSYGVSREVGGGCMSRPGCLACDERSTLLVRTGREIQKNLTSARVGLGPWRPWLAPGGGASAFRLGGWRRRPGLAAQAAAVTGGESSFLLCPG